MGIPEGHPTPPPQPSHANPPEHVERCYSEQDLSRANQQSAQPIPMLLWCPECGDRHVDVGEFATKAHHTHACQSCGMVWRPCLLPTVGVQWLPGFKNE